MAIQSAPFFDPLLAQQQRTIAFDTATGVADLQLKGQRIQEDQNLFRPFLERRFGEQANRTAGGVAGRGFHGNQSGIMRDAMGRLTEEQAYTAGEFERGSTRGLEDVERAIANLTARGAIQGAEGVRQGAGRASQRVMPNYIDF